MKILHIHQDYPDGRDYPFTKAISNLIHATENYTSDVKHCVLSINRTSNPFKISIKKFEQGYSVVYWALPLPYIYLPVIYFWSFIFSLVLRHKGINMIHGHKLTTEGLLSRYLAKFLDVKYVISVRGGSDFHNLNRLPDCRNAFKKVFSNASKVFWVSPWVKNTVEKKLSENSNKILLPNICQIENIKPCINPVNKRYCIVLSLHQYQRKGVLQLLVAIASLKENGKIILLDIIGSGESKFQKIIMEEVARLKLGKQIEFVGELNHGAVMEYLKHAKGLLLPAVNETFGMTYIESLACGTPILYMANTGIDGHLDDVDLGVKIENQNSTSIEKGIIALEDNFALYRETIENTVEINYLSKFTEHIIAKQYMKEIMDIKGITNGETRS